MCFQQGRIQGLIWLLGAGKYPETLQVFTDARFNALPSEEVVRRAKEQAIMDMPYSKFFNSCEHFAYRCKYGLAISSQVEDVVAAVLFIPAVLVAIVLNLCSLVLWRNVWAFRGLSMLKWDPCLMLLCFCLGLYTGFLQKVVSQMPPGVIKILTVWVEWSLWVLALGGTFWVCLYVLCALRRISVSALLGMDWLFRWQDWQGGEEGRIRRHTRHHRYHWLLSRLDLHWPFTLPLIYAGSSVYLMVWSYVLGWAASAQLRSDAGSD